MLHKRLLGCTSNSYLRQLHQFFFKFKNPTKLKRMYNDNSTVIIEVKGQTVVYLEMIRKSDMLQFQNSLRKNIVVSP